MSEKQNEFERAMWQVIQERAQELGMSQADVAKKAGVSQSSVGRYYRVERQGGISDTEAIAEAVGMTFDFALGMAARTVRGGKGVPDEHTEA